MELALIIQSKIYEIRGQRVMIDKDLAELYQVTTGNLNKAVKRNIKRFPSDFMFQLSAEEFETLKSNLIFQNGISSWGGVRKLPYAFTEQGLAMLSGVLNSDRIGKLEQEVQDLKAYIEEVFTDYNDINDDTRMQLELINQTLAEMQAQRKVNSKPRNPIGFIKPE